jgi:hypothetical protein
MAIHPYHAHQSERLRLPYDEIVRNLERAQYALRDDPDLAALYLDGALRVLLALAANLCGAQPAHADEALYLLDRQRPLLAQRFRLALRAPNPEARLIHSRSLLDLLRLGAAQRAPDHALKG